MTQKLDFIHIGLGKCMSSRLQGYWQLDEGTHSMSASGISNAIDEVIRGGFPDTKAIREQCAQININFPPSIPGSVNMLTSESLTFSFLHEPEMGEMIVTKDAIASELLSGLSDKILMLVRDPIEWITSCYAQQVKEGGLIAMNAYLDSHRAVILNNLDLTRRVREWSRTGAEVIVLPIELARRDDVLFWDAYETRLGVSRPANWQGTFDVVGNNVTAYETIEAHRRMNAALLALEGTLEGTDLPQKTEMIKFMTTVRKLCIRRGFSFADKKALEEIRSALNLEAGKDDPGTPSLDAAYLDAIETQFMQALRQDKQFQDYGCLDGYAF